MQCVPAWPFAVSTRGRVTTQQHKQWSSNNRKRLNMAGSPVIILILIEIADLKRLKLTFEMMLRF